MLGLSVDTANEWANRLYIIFGALAIFATAIALIASFVMWRTSTAISDRKDSEFAEFKLKSEEITSRFEKEAAQAKNEQEKLQQSNLLLQQSIESEKLQRIRIQSDLQKLQPRSLDFLQSSSLSVGLKNHLTSQATVDISADAACFDCQRYALQISNVLSGNSMVKVQNLMVMGIGNSGKSGVLITISPTNLKSGQEIVDAFAFSKIPFDTVTQSTMNNNVSILVNAVLH